MAERTWHNEHGAALTEPGPWQDEPDKVQWVDAATDLDALAVRNHWGSWCGYVGVPPGHPLHGVSFHDLPYDLEVHGGLTFAGGCDEEAPEGTGICHIPEPGRPAEVWWLGFDCGHAWDLQPGMVQFEKETFGHESGTMALFERIGRTQTYRDLDYVRREVAGLAAQLAHRDDAH
jgi:hypothetical protein